MVGEFPAMSCQINYIKSTRDNLGDKHLIGVFSGMQLGATMMDMDMNRCNTKTNGHIGCEAVNFQTTLPNSVA